jgi:prepilin-type processing-associated H-X9-DG protein
MSFAINEMKRRGISSQDANGASVAYVDGSVRFLKDSTTADQVKARFTVASVEAVSPE